ncbi:hypothetical protein GA0115234_11625 [Streptomyces sp. DvalAA-43]|nr:hypothetical protein GA0115234_11625 [Streptomyces sp. DvalAA-43]
MGWQRQRAWMEVFSSLGMTYSSSPSGSPSKVRAYRSSTRVALAWKSGSRMKIQDRYCQGLIASALSQRRTVEADMAAAMALATTSRASSGHDQHDSGVPVSAGNWQASALTSATCSGVNEGGRPERSRSARAGRPPAANRPRQVRTVSTCIRVCAAIRVLERPEPPAARWLPATGPDTGSCDHMPSSSAGGARMRSGGRARQGPRAREGQPILRGTVGEQAVTPVRPPDELIGTTTASMRLRQWAIDQRHQGRAELRESGRRRPVASRIAQPPRPLGYPGTYLGRPRPQPFSITSGRPLSLHAPPVSSTW